MADRTPHPELRQMLEIFTGKVRVPPYEPIAPDAVPQPYRDLLVHSHHMTVTVERFHGCRVALRVIADHLAEPHYSRMILLELERSGEVVQFGVMRIDLSCCSNEVRSEILARNTPLGRILIEHNVLREIDPIAFQKITLTDELQSWFGLAEPTVGYGRTAIIYCNGLPAIELLEIVRPELSK